MKVKLLVVLAGLWCSALFAQHAASPSQRYFRFICLVHLTGTGKDGDIIRPDHVADSAVPSRRGILAWSSQMSDDGTMAIVQFVASSRSAFAPLLSDARPEIRVFEIGTVPPAVIERELRKVKKDFTLESLEVPVQ